MHLYLMRHAEAERAAGDILSDAARPLTAYGRFQAKTIADELKRRAISPFIATSPFLRTVQTAEILCETLGITTCCREESLASTGHAPDLAALLQTYANAQHLLLLGHQPDLGQLAEKLLGFEFGFGTATIAVFEFRSAATWHFLWTASPEMLVKK